jgi:hypothetical protein
VMCDGGRGGGGRGGYYTPPCLGDHSACIYDWLCIVKKTSAVHVRRLAAQQMARTDDGLSMVVTVGPSLRAPYACNHHVCRVYNCVSAHQRVCLWEYRGYMCTRMGACVGAMTVRSRATICMGTCLGATVLPYAGCAHACMSIHMRRCVHARP